MAAAVDQKVHDLYERYPYPKQGCGINARALRNSVVRNNPFDAWERFFPSRARPQQLRILVAGCGTQIAPLLAAGMPNATVVGIDICASALQQSRKLVSEGGLTNCTLEQLAIEQVPQLGQSFDYIHCHGVLHHLADPEQGLRVLGEVLDPEGAISVMVYAQYGRTGIYMVQDLLRTLGAEADDAGVALAQTLHPGLRAQHPFRMVHSQAKAPLPDEEIADMLLHPRDVAYDVPGIRELLSAAGLKHHRWLLNAPYCGAGSPLTKPPFADIFAKLDYWQRSAAMELFYGVMVQHEFVVTHPNRPSQRELFGAGTMENARLRRCPHLGHRVLDNGLILLSNSAHLLKFELPLRAGLHLQVVQLALGDVPVKDMSASLGVPLERLLAAIQELVDLDILLPSLPE